MDEMYSIVADTKYLKPGVYDVEYTRRGKYEVEEGKQVTKWDAVEDVEITGEVVAWSVIRRGGK